MISHDFIEEGSGIFFASIKSNVPPPTPAIFEVLLFLILVDLLVELESLVKGVSTLWLFTQQHIHCLQEFFCIVLLV